MVREVRGEKANRRNEAVSVSSDHRPFDAKEIVVIAEPGRKWNVVKPCAGVVSVLRRCNAEGEVCRSTAGCPAGGKTRKKTQHRDTPVSARLVTRME